MPGAWAVLDHQRRTMPMELEWLNDLIERLRHSN
jgi:hypothetical protein